MHQTGQIAQTIGAHQVEQNTPSCTSSSQYSHQSMTPIPNVVINIQQPIGAKTEMIHADAKTDNSHMTSQLNQDKTVTNESSKTDTNKSITTQQSADLSVEEIEARRLQEILIDLTSDEIDRAIELINASKFSQTKIEAEAQLISTQENSLPICHMPGDNRPYVEVLANGVKRHPLLDSGAMVTLISYVNEDELTEYQARIEKTNVQVSTVNAAKHEASGFMWLTYEVAGKTARIPTILMKSHRSYFIVGINFWQAFNIHIGWDASVTTQPWNKEKSNDILTSPTMGVVECTRTLSRDSNQFGTFSTEIEPSSSASGILSIHSRVSPRIITKSSCLLPKYQAT